MPDFRITIEVKNVARGDIATLCAQILEDHGADFDAARGEFRIRTSERPGQSGQNYFPYDWEADED